MKKLALALSACALVITTGPAMAAQSPSGRLGSTWCADVSTTPCIESATRNGSNVTSTDLLWTVFVTTSDFSLTHSHDALWSVWKNGDNELGTGSLADTWVIDVEMGDVVPRVAFTHGDGFVVDRVHHGDGTWDVTVTATPVALAAGCDQTSWPWTCPSAAPPDQDWDGYLDGEITDYEAWNDPAQRDSFFGMNFASNVAATSLPPEIVNDPATGADQILIRLANPHTRADGTTVFQGFVHQRIPNSFLHTVYGIDDPSTLTGSGLTTVVSGSSSGSGTSSVTQEASGDAMLVDITGITFSARRVLIKRGVITPTRPTALVGHRPSASTGRVGFHAARPRGSRITGYTARCTHGSSVVVATGSASPLSVGGLHGGVPYSCQVKARSKAGAGRWSAAVTVPAHVGA